MSIVWSNLKDRNFHIEVNEGGVEARRYFSMTEESTVSMWIKAREILIGGFLLVLGGIICFLALAQFRLQPPYWIAWFLFLLSLVTSSAGVIFCRDRQTSKSLAVFNRPVARKLAWGSLAFILVIGLLIRVYNITELPYGLWYDEADNILNAVEFNKNPGKVSVFSPSTHLPTPFLILIAFVQEGIGYNWIAGRLVAGLFSLGLIASLYFLGNQLGGVLLGVGSAYLACVLRWSVNWGRIGMHGITAAFFSALSAYLLLRAVKNWDLAWFFWAGFSVGIGMWFYASFRAFPVVVGAIFLVGMYIEFPGWKRIILASLTFLWASFLSSAPVIQFAVLDHEAFFERSRELWLFTFHEGTEIWMVLRDSLIEHLLMFNISGDPNPRHNIPHEPMLDVVTGALFIIGIAMSFTHKNRFLLIFPIWILVMILPGVFTVPWESPQSLRSIGAMPAVIVISVLPIVVLINRGRTVFGTLGHRFIITFAVAIALTVGAVNIHGVFSVQANNSEVFNEFSTAETIMAKRMQTYKNSGYSLYSSRQFLHSLPAYVIGNGTHYEAIRSPRDIPLNLNEIQNGAVIYLEPREKGVFDILQIYYPEGDFKEIRTPSGSKIILFEVVLDREVIKHSHGVSSHIVLSDSEVFERSHSTLSVPWNMMLDDERFPAKFLLETSLHIREGDEYHFKIRGIGSLDIDGNKILPSQDGIAKIRLGVGLHNLKISGLVQSSSEFTELLWRRPFNDWHPVSDMALYKGSVKPVGIAGVFESGGGVPFSAEVTGTVDTFYYDIPIDGPYSVVWAGYITPPVSGDYQFHVSSNSEMNIVIEGHMFSSSDPYITDFSTEKVSLRKDQSHIVVQHNSAGVPPKFRLEWTLPNGARETLPLHLITPDPTYMNLGETAQ